MTSNHFKRVRWKRRQLIIFLERLDLYVSSGLALDKALFVCGDGTPPRHRRAIEEIHAGIMGGRSLSRMLATCIGLPQTHVGLIAHGESSGELARSLRMAKVLLEREDDLIKKCLSALAYPGIIGIFSLILTIGLVRGVMPQITPMLTGLHVQLPLLTRIVIAVSDFIGHKGIYVLIIVVLGAFATSILYRKTRWLKTFVHSGLMRIPLIGNMSVGYALFIFLHSCGSLVESGMPAGEAFDRTSSSIPLTPLAQRLSRHGERVRAGIAVGLVLKEAGIRGMPSFVAPLVHAGESSGALGASLIRAADILDRDLEHSLRRLTSLIEPVMMIGMGIAIGSISLSIMMPIYDLSRVLQR